MTIHVRFRHLALAVGVWLVYTIIGYELSFRNARQIAADWLEGVSEMVRGQIHD